MWSVAFIASVYGLVCCHSCCSGCFLLLLFCSSSCVFLRLYSCITCVVRQHNRALSSWYCLAFFLTLFWWTLYRWMKSRCSHHQHRRRCHCRRRRRRQCCGWCSSMLLLLRLLQLFALDISLVCISLLFISLRFACLTFNFYLSIYVLLNRRFAITAWIFLCEYSVLQSIPFPRALARSLTYPKRYKYLSKCRSVRIRTNTNIYECVRVCVYVSFYVCCVYTYIICMCDFVSVCLWIVLIWVSRNINLYSFIWLREVDKQKRVSYSEWIHTYILEWRTFHSITLPLPY